MTGIAGMLDPICPVTRLAGMMGECNDDRGRPTAQGNEGKGKAVQKQSFGPAAAGFATHGSERRVGFFKKAHGVGKSVNQTSSKPRDFLFLPGSGSFQLLGSFLADFNEQT
ncbi:hypothetical protein CEK62_17535 [Alcanivorax sp. N3-2A]|nr:hypothetical protein CEK62_17535 [Alcanivorax sp. N3-2A]